MLRERARRAPRIHDGTDGEQGVDQHPIHLPLFTDRP